MLVTFLNIQLLNILFLQAHNRVFKNGTDHPPLDHNGSTVSNEDSFDKPIGRLNVTYYVHFEITTIMCY